MDRGSAYEAGITSSIRAAGHRDKGGVPVCLWSRPILGGREITHRRREYNERNDCCGVRPNWPDHFTWFAPFLFFLRGEDANCKRTTVGGSKREGELEKGREGREVRQASEQRIVLLDLSATPAPGITRPVRLYNDDYDYDFSALHATDSVGS